MGLPAHQVWSEAEALLARGAPAEAGERYERLRADDQFGAMAALRLSLLAGRAGDFRRAVDEALDAYRRRRPDPDLLEMVAKRLMSLGEKKHALDTVQQLLRLPGARITTLADLGKLLSDSDEPAAALPLLQRAEAGGLSSAALHYLIGLSQMYAGDREQAREQLEKSLSLDPGFARSHWALVKLSPGDDGGRHRDRLLASVARLEEGHPDLPLLLYALFHRLDGAGDTEDAWRALSRGMAARRAQVRHDREAEARMFRLLESSRALPEADAPAGPVPIFILGLPRTGTTLLDHLLGQHPDVARAGELRDFNWVLRWTANRGGVPLLDASLVQELVDRPLEGLGGRYLERTRWRAGDRPFYTDKLPPNFLNIGWIAGSLPQARIVHLVRNPMDACFSNLKELFAAPYAYSYDQLEMAGHYGRYRRLMAHWHERFPGRILDVDYEDLAREPQEAVRKVLRHCGLEPHAGEAAATSAPAVEATASAMQVREPVHQRGIGAWQRYAAHLGPLQRELAAAGFAG